MSGCGAREANANVVSRRSGGRGGRPDRPPGSSRGRRGRASRARRARRRRGRRSAGDGPRTGRAGCSCPRARRRRTSFSTASHGIRRRSAAIASRARVSSFSFTSSRWRAASHSAGVTIGGCLHGGAPFWPGCPRVRSYCGGAATRPRTSSMCSAAHRADRPSRGPARPGTAAPPASARSAAGTVPGAARPARPVTRPTSASRARCLAIACRVIGSRAARSVAVAGPPAASAARMARRLGSASATKTCSAIASISGGIEVFDQFAQLARPALGVAVERLACRRPPATARSRFRLPSAGCPSQPVQV